MLHLKHRHLVKNSVNDSRCAQKVSDPRNGEPEVWIDEGLLDCDKKANENHDDGEKEEILCEYDVERIFDGYVVLETLVDVIKKLLRLVRFVLFYSP